RIDAFLGEDLLEVVQFLSLTRHARPDRARIFLLSHHSDLGLRLDSTRAQQCQGANGNGTHTRQTSHLASSGSYLGFEPIVPDEPLMKPWQARAAFSAGRKTITSRAPAL